MTTQEAWEKICYWLQTYVGVQPAALIVSAIAAIYLLIFNKDIRVRIIVPILFLVPVVINPVLFKIIYYQIIYWRLFWMLPEGLLIAAATIDLCGRFKRLVAKCVCLAIMSLVIVFTGSNVFLREAERTGPTDNLYGVNAITRSVCDTILADNPHPKCIFVDWVYDETRMYSADIEQLYGRDYEGYIYPINPEIKADAKRWMQEPRDWDYLFEYAEAHGITHVCIPAGENERAIAKNHGFTLIGDFERHAVFRNDALVNSDE